MKGQQIKQKIHVIIIDYWDKLDLYSIDYEGKSRYVIIPDKWEGNIINEISLGSSNDDVGVEYFYIPESVVSIQGDLSVYFDDTKKIYYDGTKKDWDKIEFEESFDYNKVVKNVKIEYNVDLNISEK